MYEPLVKLCGNRSLSDVEKTASSSATHLGFIFVNKTKRYVRPEQVGRWIRKVRPKQKLVGVFVDPSIDQLDEVLAFAPLDVIQLHGNETVSEVLKIKETFGLPVWKVIHHQANGQEQMDLFQGVADGYVIDSKVDGAHGGTGVQFDWEAIQSYKQMANDHNVSCFIAGGINPDNIKQLMTHEPDGIDISSGIETNGQKDINKIQAVLKEVDHHVASFS
ncbi:phosphoribosylanthranilate isomerase [Halobacillus shinanisalinarum]|uniref:N-(5'-phosphoribosyl)anthranilate isomerase n=1 Tax=Halobacillus shinanisalinarum TaxID=2932258 RepID=A0ABY4GX73_9BACI|nr:phosphoribosylanthranilate isomerase [Halobacillus shinanisalinarum]UOQ92571.1 phosphoribosylanthranilate isomerase [Halobacillus shinanisalinarum]